MDFDRDNSAGYVANHMARLFARRLAEEIKPLGIVPGQFPILLELWRQDGQTQKMLVEALDVEQATMANTLTRMERDGLIARKPDPSDQRVRRIFLTAKARGLEKAATQAAERVNAMALDGMDDGGRRAFLNAMRSTVEALSRS